MSTAKAQWARRKAADHLRFAAALTVAPGSDWRAYKTRDRTMAFHYAEASRFQRMADRWEPPAVIGWR